MITVYLLKNCKHCSKLLKYIIENPSLNICFIIVSKCDLDIIKKKEPRISSFPVAFIGIPNKNGLPYKSSKMINDSSKIISYLNMKFGKLQGSNIKINYNNNNSHNVKNLNNIRQYRNNCFGNNCHIMDRPYGPTDNQYILQGFQPKCAIPIRSDLPIKKNKFGNATPGTKEWKLQRKIWQCPEKLINDKNNQQNLNGNKKLGMNVPLTYKDDYLNQTTWNPLKKNNYGKKFISAPVNQTEPFLTYAAGGNGISRITGKNFLREQIPIEKTSKNSYISGDIKKYAMKNSNDQKLLSNGLKSNWSINDQGINNNSNYGNNNPWILTNTNSGSNTNQTQYFKRQRFKNNGNSFGYKKTTTPLGIEIYIK